VEDREENRENLHGPVEKPLMTKGGSLSGSGASLKN